ncbi:Protein CBG25984 [Caenorhabditis briggsae]|uniref:Protein CBG25984 n=1 Tax=Caenorhabditis briggsae TaxID=6238 RepID=B6IKT4_CAEBR|nr:Protein CBG25984 [Caenorhabditis briggsae]CAS00514.1 Protein CBG25984 [Caenorhabditis briggsae]
MYFSFLQFAFTFLIYLYTVFVVYRNGYSRSVRKWFKLMTNNSGTIVIFTVIALILMGVNFSKACDSTDLFLGTTFEIIILIFVPVHWRVLGYSAWLSCAAAVLSLGNFILAMVIAENECN